MAGVYPSTGLATWYNPDYNALGEVYRQGEFTCAMRKRNFGKKLLVCNKESNKCVVVKHDDFGPAFYHFTTGKIIDLSRDAFLKIADLEKGVIRVRIGEINPGEVNMTFIPGTQ